MKNRTDSIMAKKATILLVDDDPRLLRFVGANLRVVGYKVLVAGDAETAMELLASESPDLVILDILLPGMDGFQFCKRVREFSSVPIIMLTAKAEEEDKVKGLKLGADDYLTKPFGVSELLARVEAVLRRSESPAETVNASSFNCNELAIDFLRHVVTKRGEEVHLTPTEYRLLSLLAKNADKVVLHEDIHTHVWGAEYRSELEYLRAYVRHLRRKIEDDPSQPRYIISKPGVGYTLVRPCSNGAE